VLPRLLDEIEGLIEKFIDLILLVILSGEVEIEGHIFFAMPEQSTPGN